MRSSFSEPLNAPHQCIFPYNCYVHDT